MPECLSILNTPTQTDFVRWQEETTKKEKQDIENKRVKKLQDPLKHRLVENKRKI